SPGSAPVLLENSSKLNLTGATASGTFVFRGAGTLTGSVATGQSLVLQGAGCVGGAYVTAPAGFTNAGSIELTNVRGTCVDSQPAQLEWSGTLTNTGTLTTAFGSAGGSRTLNGSLTNKGTVNIKSGTAFDGSSALFDNKGAVAVTNGATLSTDSGQTFDNDTGGSISTTSGALSFQDTIFDVGAGSPGSAPVLLANGSTLNLNGAAAGTFVFRGGGDTLNVPTGTVAAGQSIVLQSVGCVSSTDVTAPAGFTNAGSIELTNVKGTCTESEPAQLEWSGTLTNTGTLTSAAGAAGGSRTLNGNLTNSHALNINASTSLGSGSQLTNNGTLTLGAGKTLSLQGAAFTQESAGDLVENVASASSFGRLHNPGGTDLLGGTLTLDTASGYAPPHATKFLFMTFSSETGKFAANVFKGHNYSVKYDPADVTLSALDNTTTTVGFSSSGTQVGDAVTVTAKITGPEAPGNPTGKITFSSGGPGTFTPATTCTLAATATAGVSECSVTYTPSAVGSGTHTITASYPGDGNYVKSSGSSPLTVTTRTTSTTLECNPTSVASGIASTCTATITDTNAGTASTPTGTVGFSSNGAGSFSTTNCTLAASATPGTASCSVTYTPSATGTQTITGSYGGDATHALSSNGTSLTVT
ncbi:MAG TPA: Ig-like domain repeat protein, partial [Solirubrobacteraceae bacterium]|nr:Ig-like domain repeat protein [Solirubrobacteraceae bacterium]